MPSRKDEIDIHSTRPEWCSECGRHFELPLICAGYTRDDLCDECLEAEHRAFCAAHPEIQLGGRGY